ncbi:MAG: hypothetical protein QOF77_217 [Solirubrobacteraceae bacterium]|nr:hypothetical protein [Solirubrobacteraceae bacterium]
MDFEKLARRAQEIYVERGGADAARGDARELEEIARGQGSLTEKAKLAAKALKRPGAATRATEPTPSPDGESRD